MATAALAKNPKDAIFEWEGRDKNGKAVRGEIRAGGEAVVSASLRRQGILITKIKKRRTSGGRSIKQKDITFLGHAIECRINAENPRTFRPSPGQITYWHPPGGLGVRVDSGVYQGYRIPPYYDSLIGKLIVHGKTRNECLMRLKRALSEFVIDGIETTIPLFNELIQQPDIANGLYDIHWLEKYLAKS